MEEDALGDTVRLPVGNTLPQALLEASGVDEGCAEALVSGEAEGGPVPVLAALPRGDQVCAGDGEALLCELVEGADGEAAGVAVPAREVDGRATVPEDDPLPVGGSSDADGALLGVDNGEGGSHRSVCGENKNPLLQRGKPAIVVHWGPAVTLGQ